MAKQKGETPENKIYLADSTNNGNKFFTNHRGMILFLYDRRQNKDTLGYSDESRLHPDSIHALREPCGNQGTDGKARVEQGERL